MRLPEDFIRLVRESNDIVAVVQERIKLERKGKDYRCLCPFHDDHSPSLNVSPTMQIYKCFSCGAAGGVIAFVQKFHKLSFLEAVELLANRTGLQMPTAETNPLRFRERDDLRSINDWAAHLYAELLHDKTRGEPGRDYFAERGLSDQTIQDFRLGYAPPDWDFLLKQGRSAGYREEQLQLAGLIKPRPNGDGFYDAFRNRVIFPIVDGIGKVVGFGGRALSRDDKPKYINSPETALFSKSRCLYALEQARPAIAQSNHAIIVEGYMDVLMAHQHDVRNVVATLGTALTAHHVDQLMRGIENLTVVFDADRAGKAAADKALDVAVSRASNVYVATLPDGMDPCDLLLAEGAEAFLNAIGQREEALNYLWRQVPASRKDPSCKSEQAVTRYLLHVLQSARKSLDSPVARGFLINRLNVITGIDAGELQRLCDRVARGDPPPALNEQALIGRLAAYTDILAAVLSRPELLGEASGVIDLDEVEDFRLFVYLRCMLDRYDLGEPVTMLDLLDLIPQQQARTWLIQLHADMQQSQQTEQRLQAAVSHLQRLRQQMKDALAASPTLSADGASELNSEEHRLQRVYDQARRADRRRPGPPLDS